MSIDRRKFLKYLGGLGSLTLFGRTSSAHASGHSIRMPDQYGVLIDTTLCVGCRSCEKACNKINEDLPRKPTQFFKDKSVLDKRRRMDFDSYTVINRYQNQRVPGNPVYAKFQCMHCNDAACVSACIVGALTKDENGAVVYDAWKCIGCRYCMAACPFQVPAYEYNNILTPQVRKCTFCFEKRTSKGKIPACVQSCPMEAMTFGKRRDLIKMARKRIKKYPDQYVHHIYGEREVGGTSWLYLSSLPFDKIDLPKLGYTSLPSYTEPIQHAIFKHFIPPLAWYGLLGGFMWFLRPKKEKTETAQDEKGIKK